MTNFNPRAPCGARRNTCPAVMTSTVKSAGTPSAGSVEKKTLHACITSTLEKFCCTQTGSANVPSSPLMASGALVGGLIRFVVHFISGITIYRIYEPTEVFNHAFTNPYLYSLVYNGSYVAIDMVLCLVIFAVLYVPLKKYITGQDLG